MVASKKAKVVLEEAAKLSPAEPMAQYNLACYCAQLGQLDDTQEHLGKFNELGGCQADQAYGVGGGGSEAALGGGLAEDVGGFLISGPI